MGKKHIGDVIKLVRVSAGLKQTELALIADVSISYISLIEQGKRDPNFSTIQDIFESLAFSPTLAMFLLEGDNEMSQELSEKLAYATLANMRRVENTHLDLVARAITETVRE